MQLYREKSLDYFGKRYELKVLRQIVGIKEKKKARVFRDAKFGRNILPIMKVEHYHNEVARRVLVLIKNYYKERGMIPYFDTLKSLVRSKISDEFQQGQLMEYIAAIEKVDGEDAAWVEANTLDFINTKNLYLAWEKVEQQLISRGKYDRYWEAAEIFRKAVVKDLNEERLEAFTAGDNKDLDEGERHPIPTGIEPLDWDMNGGLAYGELALVVAALKVGKTSFASYIANHAAMNKYKVLQLYFEDTDAQVKLKHRSRLTGMSLGDISKKRNRKLVTKKSDEKLNQMYKGGGCIVMHKMDSTESTVDDIERVYLKAKEEGVWFQKQKETKQIKFDIVLIDYVDCIKPKGRYQKSYEGDIEVIRQLEKLCSRKYGHNFACWTFTQGGRSSLNTALVTGEETGGSIKKLQVAHFIASIAKTLEQRAEKQATFAILGSRVGRDGIIYKDCTFDNGKMLINFNKEEPIGNFVVNEFPE